MSKHTVAVHQLMSDTGESFFNVDAQEGSLCVWTSTHEKPTFVLLSGANLLSVIQFDSDAWAEEWFSEHGRNCETVWKADNGLLELEKISHVEP